MRYYIRLTENQVPQQAETWQFDETQSEAVCRVGGGALDCSRADLRPPLKRNVRFSRIPLS